MHFKVDSLVELNSEFPKNLQQFLSIFLMYFREMFKICNVCGILVLRSDHADEYDSEEVQSIYREGNQVSLF